MAVSYLARAGRRALAEPAAGVRPAMPSRSPVAEVDQRLNVDAFAQHFGAHPGAPPVGGEIEAPEEVLDVGNAPEAASTRARRKRIARRVAASYDVPAETVAALSPSADSIPKTAAVDAVSARRPAAPTRQRAKPAARESSDAIERERRGDSRRTSEPSRREQVHPQAEIVRETHTVTTVRSEDSAHEGVRRGAAPPVSLEPSLKSVLDAVERATSWIEAGERRADRGRTARPLHPPAPAPQARALAPRPQPVTHLEIGRIEVEVVAPAKPAAASSRPQAGAPTSGAPAASQPVFGWRQR